MYKEKRLCEDGDRGAWWVKVLSMRLQKSRGIIHWDLTLSNLLRNENQVKISDFGLSNEHSPREKLDTFCRTAAYTPLSSSRGGAAWAHLRTCVEPPCRPAAMVTGSCPFQGQDFWQLWHRVLIGQYHVVLYAIWYGNTISLIGRYPTLPVV